LRIVAITVASVIVAKLILWPLALWLLATKRARAMVLSLLLATGVTLLA
jgi:hypothetical protein